MATAKTTVLGIRWCHDNCWREVRVMSVTTAKIGHTKHVNARRGRVRPMDGSEHQCAGPHGNLRLGCYPSSKGLPQSGGVTESAESCIREGIRRTRATSWGSQSGSHDDVFRWICIRRCRECSCSMRRARVQCSCSFITFHID